MVPRSLLAGLDPHPDRVLDEIARRRLAEWYALRYTRPSWPNEFIERIGDRKDALDAIVRPLGDNVEIRVALRPNDQELEAGAPYGLALFFVVDEDVWNNDVDERERIVGAFAQFRAVLVACEGVELDETSDVISGATFSWQQTRASEEWNFANLSHREG